MSEQAKPTVQEAMVAVMASVGAIGKGRQAPAEAGGYRFRGIDEVLNALHPALVEHGVIVTPEVLERSVDQQGKWRLVSLLVRYTFHGPAGDTLACSAWGEGRDTTDKAAAKAMSTAMKTAMFQALAIPVEGSSFDTEADKPFVEEELAPVKLTGEEDAILAELMHHFAGLDDGRQDKLRDWLEGPGQVGRPVGDRLEELPPRWFAKVEELIEKAAADLAREANAG